MTSQLIRALRALVLIAGTAVTTVVAAVPAFGAGVGGVEVTPRDGSAFHLTVSKGDAETEAFDVRNIGSGPATVRLYAASATQEKSGTWSVAGAGSAPWLEFADREVTLEPGQSRELTFRVRGSEQERNGAIVIEQGTGTVVQRAATLVYVKPGAALPLPLLVVVIATALLVVTGIAVAATAKRRSKRPSTSATLPSA